MHTVRCENAACSQYMIKRHVRPKLDYNPVELPYEALEEPEMVPQPEPVVTCFSCKSVMKVVGP